MNAREVPVNARRHAIADFVVRLLVLGMVAELIFGGPTDAE